MSDRTAELMRLCFEKVDLPGEDAAFFQNVMNALLEARVESEAQERREEAHVWFDKWREPLYGHRIDSPHCSNW